MLMTVSPCSAKTSLTSFEVTTSAKVYAIGNPIDVVFETHNLNRSLSSLNLDKLKNNFIVHDYNVDKFEDMYDGQILRIENLVVRLYPKRAGHIEIPAFKLGRYKSHPIFIDVINDFNSSIQIRTTSIKDSYYQREPINIYVDVFYRQKKIISSVGKLKNKNFIISDVKRTEYTIRDNGINLPVDRFSWIVIPLTEGKHVLNLPMVKTGGRRMYPSGSLKLTVTALPSTLPSLIPVSKQKILDNIVTKDRIWINKVYYWSFSIIGNGLNENILDKIISNQLESNLKIRYFPRSYSRTRIDNGSQFKTDVKVPFKLYDTGEYSLPKIDLPYIDAETGILEHAYSSVITINAISHLNENLKILIALILFIAIVIQPVLKLIKRFYIKYRYRVCYYSLVITNNPKRLKNYIFKLTPNFNDETPSTIKSWEESAVVSDPEHKKILKKISTLLNNFNYGTRYSKSEITVLKKLIKKLI
jgi:hypothetical protein